MAEFRCTVVTDPAERSEQTRRITIFLKYQEELFAPFEYIASSSKAFPSGGKERRGERASLVSLLRPSPPSRPRFLESSTSSAAASSLSLSLFVAHNARDWNHAARTKFSLSLSRACACFERKRIRWLSNSCLKTYQRYTTFPPPPGVKLISINKKRSPLVFSFTEREM